MEGRHKARQITHKFNNLDPNGGNYEEIGAKREAILKDILGSVGEGTFIEPPFLPDYGCNIIIGKNCFMNFGYVTQLLHPRPSTNSSQPHYSRH